MKKSDLKKTIKPLVKECIYEVLLEEGLLSNIVAEVAQGMQTTVITESRPQRPPPREDRRLKRKVDDSRSKLKEHRRKLSEAVGKDAYNGVNVFEGLEPMPKKEPPKGQADLGDPRDSGVDISDLIGNASDIWKAIK